MSDFSLVTMGNSAETKFLPGNYIPLQKYDNTSAGRYVSILIINTTPSSSASVSIRENHDEYSIVDNFVTKLAKSSKDLEPEIYKLVNSNFWDLL
jgi:hypothetical protein